ncbi:hypothetical protein BGX26_010384 [Mortierella sp. AD094]|nr:hypothetical protein BGX26_010384 [Mortierella sp. AD094]
MFESAYNSRKKVPTSTTIIMASTIIVSFVASITDKIVVRQIRPSITLRDSSFVVANSSHFTQFDSASVKFAGWTTSIPYGTNIVDALALMINDTRNIPNADSRQVCTPRTLKYEIKCGQFNVFVLDKNNGSMLLQNEGCTAGYFLPILAESINMPYVTINKISSGRWSIMAPATPDQSSLPDLMSSFISTAADEWPCTSTELVKNHLQKPQFGLATYPTTRTTKCTLPNGEVRVLSVSTVQFSTFSFMNGTSGPVPDQYSFSLGASRTFTEYDDFLQAMEYSIGNETFPLNATVLLEVKLGGSSMDAVICSIVKSSGGDSVKMFICSYITTDAFTLKPQKVNPLISSARKGRPYSISYNVTTAMTINHIVSPTIISSPLKGVDSSSKLVSMDSIRNSTVQAAHYMASLGQNFYADYDEGHYM